jgi:hypothetical protein
MLARRSSRQYKGISLTKAVAVAAAYAVLHPNRLRNI